MARYSYVAKDIDGVIHKGVMDVPDESVLRARLKRDDLFATSIKPLRESSLFKIGLFETITSKEIAEFAEQFAIMIEAGLSMIQCLETLLGQVKNQKFLKVIAEVKNDVENGIPLSNALGKHPKVFSNLFVSLIKAGEVGGTLPTTFRQISDYLDKEQDNKQKVKSAMAYPKLVGAVCFAVLIFMLTYIIPRFAAIYDGLGITLPMITLTLVAISRFILKYWWSMIIFVGILIFVYYRLKGSKSGIIDRIKLGMPVFGVLYKKSAISRFVYVLSSLHGGGVPILQSLEVARDVMDNKVIEQVIDTARVSVNAGGRIRDAIAVSKLFPIIVIQMISVGEETGGLALSLEKSAIYLNREVDAVVKRIITRVEPGLTIVIGVIVAIIAAAIYMPVFDVVKIVQK
jgi:type IV pilus assembly protein PilC